MGQKKKDAIPFPAGEGWDGAKKEGRDAAKKSRRI
jgi:hypothetical protein